jgi:hypothetical protein
MVWPDTLKCAKNDVSYSEVCRFFLMHPADKSVKKGVARKRVRVYNFGFSVILKG